MGKLPSRPNSPKDRGVGGDDFVVLVDESVDPRVVIYHDPQSESAERFRAFRTTLLATLPPTKSKLLTLTSSLEDEGKSITVANLGIALADLPHTRVALLDADLRRPSLHRMFSIREHPGVANYLLDGVGPESIARSVCLGTLDVLPAGSESRRAVDLLGSDRFRELLDLLRSRYDYVLVDTPPTCPYSDSLVVGKHTDGVVLVTRLQHTARATVEQTVARIRQSGCKLIGAFLVGDDR